MRTLEVQGLAGISRILIGEHLARLPNYLPDVKVIIITDENVEKLYRDDFPPHDLITIGTGEKVKTLETVNHIYEQLVTMEADRSCFIVGIGGGIVCDISGFVASTYLRGVRFGFVASTLLSQVDASVGGKNGVNFAGYKNMVGTFNQPDFVICDIQLLETLPEAEILSGFGEVVKHAVLDPGDLFEYLEANTLAALDLDSNVVEKLVYDSVKLKAEIVGLDEREKGERRKLNLGHTFGHAIEKTEQIPHGAAVSVGMVAAARLSARKGLLPEATVNRIIKLLGNMTLPIGQDINEQAVFDALKRDKKRLGDTIKFILPTDIGMAIVTDIPLRELEQALNELF